jgi:putative membrane protein
MKTILLIIAGMTGLMAVPSAKRHQSESQDSKFVQQAAEGGMLEVKLGALASQKGMSAKVKEFTIPR